MKLRFFLTALTAASVLAISGCSKSKADEQAAIEQFKKEADGVESWFEEKKKSAGANPMAGMALVKELVAKLRAMNNENLPDDLKQAYGDFVGQLGKMEALLGELGSTPAEMLKNATSNPQLMQSFGPRMQAIEAEMKPVMARLKEVATKYGVAKLAEIGPK